MTVADVNVARPAYMNWTLFRDYHYAVFDKQGNMVYLLVMDKGTRSAYWSYDFDPTKQNIVYENHEMQARIMAGHYITQSKDLMMLLEQHHPAGEYFLSIVNASGHRLYHFSIWI